MKNIYGKGISLLPFQRKMAEKIRGKDAVLVAPTGAGKTPVAYGWGFEGTEKRTIFTAPIKALSNERYEELVKNFGQENVGINTGDVKRNVHAPVVACTQEIYTSMYASMPNQNVIVDEIHYIFENTDRARAYIDGIRKTDASSKLLLLSATLGAPERFTDYLDKVSGRNFTLAVTEARPTKQEFLGELTPIQTKNDGLTPAIVFLFSYRGVEDVAFWIAEQFSPIEDKERVMEIAARYKIKREWILWLAERGVAIYHGGLFYKEKKFAEELARERLVDFIVGTDALSLGVNLPAQTVIFGQLAKYYDGCISKREFLQMAGRAGRFGLFDTGYVGFFFSGYEAMGYDTEDLWWWLMEKDVEPGILRLTPDIGSIVRGESDIREEARYVSSFSIDLEVQDVLFSAEEIEQDIRYEIDKIDRFATEYFGEEKKKEAFIETLGELFFEEFTTEENLRVAYSCFSLGKLDAAKAFLLGQPRDGRDVYRLLQIRKFLKKARKSGFKVENMDRLERLIYEADHLVLDFPEAA